MGLAAAHQALKDGLSVTVIEADRKLGGMAAHFDFGGVSLERFYHFVCKADLPTFELLADLGISDRMRWVPTRMGYFMGGRLHPWGDPVSLLKFPELGFLDKLRYGLMAFVSTKRADWPELEHLTARQWLEGWLGRKTYEKMWAPLFRLKFFELADDISAAWIWTRIRRVGTSRKSMFQEELGYIDGGTETLIEALVESIERRGGHIRQGHQAAEVLVEDGAVKGVRLASGEIVDADAVISTVPTPFVPDLVPALPADWREKYRAIRNIPVVCIVMKLRRSVSGNFWINICDPEIEIPGIIEFSNLRPFPDSIVYVPYYMPATHPKWKWEDQRFVGEAWGYLRRLNPGLGEDDLIDAKVGRLKHAQPVCEPGFAAKIPPIQTPISGLQIADTCFYYPEDRGIAESVRLGAEMASRVAVSVRPEIVE
jgi:protoporphyrinogen oxidase